MYTLHTYENNAGSRQDRRIAIADATEMKLSHKLLLIQLVLHHESGPQPSQIVQSACRLAVRGL